MNPALKQSVLTSCFNIALSQIGCRATIVAYFCLSCNFVFRFIKATNHFSIKNRKFKNNL